MNQHKWLLNTLQIVAMESRKQPSNRALLKLRNVIETYAFEVGANEVEQIEALEHLVSEVGPLFPSDAGKASLHGGKTQLAFWPKLFMKRRELVGGRRSSC